MAETLSTKIKIIVKLVFNEPSILNALISQRLSGFMLDSGWFQSFKTKTPVDSNGQAIPWFTYSAIDFIDQRLNSPMQIFEYGSGNSTIYFSQRAAFVDALEHNPEWYELISKQVNMNSKVHLIPAAEINNYAAFPITLNKTYDIVLVDAIDRNECIYQSVNLLKEDGVIILDDSERQEYLPGISFLKNNGFRQIDFWGLAPIVLHKKCTSFFYRPQNCLGI